MSGVAGGNIGTSGSQPAIGAYVQDAAAPNANTNFIGINPTRVYATNEIGQAIGFTSPANFASATGKTAQWVQAGDAIVAGDDVTIAAGVTTVDNVSGTHTAFAAAEIGEYLWVFEI